MFPHEGRSSVSIRSVCRRPGEWAWPRPGRKKFIIINRILDSQESDSVVYQRAHAERHGPWHSVIIIASGSASPDIPSIRRTMSGSVTASARV